MGEEGELKKRLMEYLQCCGVHALRCEIGGGKFVKSVDEEFYEKAVDYIVDSAKKDLLTNICFQCCCWQQDCFDKIPSKECIKGRLQKWFGD